MHSPRSSSSWASGACTCAHHHTHHTHSTCKGAGDTLHCTIELHTQLRPRRIHATTRSAFVLLLRRRRADAVAPSSAEHAGHTPPQDGRTSHLDFEQNDLILRRQSSSSGYCARRCSEDYCRGGRRLLPWCASPPHVLQLGRARACHAAAAAMLRRRLPACCGRYAKEPHVLRISIANGYVQLVCWVFVRSLLPYAAAHAMGSNSSTAAAHEAHETGSAGELQGYAVTQHDRCRRLACSHPFSGPPTAPEAQLLARGCHLGLRGEPSPRGGRRRAAAVLCDACSK